MAGAAVKETIASRRAYEAAIDAIADLVGGIGLELTVETDFWELKEAHEANSTSGAKTAGMYDIGHGPIPADARWFAVRDRKGNTIATSAARPYDWRATDGYVEIRSGRAFSLFPDVAKRFRCTVPVEAKMLVGRVGHSGGMWIRPDWRGERDGVRLVNLLSEMNRFWAAAYWDADFVWSIIDRGLIEIGKAAHYGYRNVFPGTAIELPGQPMRWGYLVVKDRAEMTSDAQVRARKKKVLNAA